MKIALLGYGKMGKAIEQIAIARGHEIVLKISRETSYDLSQADVAIDFSVPDVATTHLSNCLKAGVPVVSGTTGWLNDYESIVALCKRQNGAFLYASNFSVGVNLFFELNKKLAALMSTQSSYQAQLEEIHHTQKLDAPSGTAITLAEDIIKEGKKNRWELVENEEAFAPALPATRGRKADTLPITSKRIGSVPGTHIITYSNPIDTITITHEAHSREGFAQGAVLAAEWILGKKGVFSMRDVLNIS